MSVENLGDFQRRLLSWRRLLAAAPETARLGIFMKAAADAAEHIAADGLDRASASDELHEMAKAHGMVVNEDDVDAVQFVISQAFERIGEYQRRAHSEANGHDKTATAPIALLRPFPVKPDDIPPRPWLVPGLLLRRQVTILVAPPGSGKSLLTLQLGMAACANVTWHGWRPRGQFKVLIINAEEDEDEMRRRLWAAQQEMDIDDGKLEGFFLAGSQDNLVIAKADARTKTVKREPMLERIIESVQANGIDIVIVDPFAETFEGDENSNSELKWCGVLWREVARRCNCAVLLVHHTRKYASSEQAGDMDAARGAGALVGIARLVATVFTMSTKEYEAFELDPDTDGERVRFIRFDDAKANQNLLTVRARWFFKKTYTLPNGKGSEPSDEVGVLRPWEPKSDALSNDEINVVLNEFTVGLKDDDGRPTGDPYTLKKSGKSNDRWAGNVVKPLRPAWDDAQITRLLKSWIDGWIVEIEVPTTTSKGQPRKGIKVNSRPPRSKKEEGELTDLESGIV